MPAAHVELGDDQALTEVDACEQREDVHRQRLERSRRQKRAITARDQQPDELRRALPPGEVAEHRDQAGATLPATQKLEVQQDRAGDGAEEERRRKTENEL